MAAAILIVEDWEDDARLLERELVRVGIVNPRVVLSSAVEAAGYLEGAFPYSDRQRYPLPKIIFLDLKLPGTDGFEFLEWLKTSNLLSDVMVIAISGVDDLASIRRAYSLGATSFLPKPPSAADLQNLITTFPGHWERSATGAPDRPARTQDPPAQGA